MTKADIVEQLCLRTDMARSAAISAVDNIIAILSDGLRAGSSIYLRGFGTLKVKEVKEKAARNISKGVAITIPAHRTVKFLPGKNLKNALK